MDIVARSSIIRATELESPQAKLGRLTVGMLDMCCLTYPCQLIISASGSSDLRKILRASLGAVGKTSVANGSACCGYGGDSGSKCLRDSESVT